MRSVPMARLKQNKYFVSKSRLVDLEKMQIVLLRKEEFPLPAADLRLVLRCGSIGVWWRTMWMDGRDWTEGNRIGEERRNPATPCRRRSRASP